METVGTIPVVRLSGKPYERGVQRGEQIPGMIHSRVDRVLSAHAEAGTLHEALNTADAVQAALLRRAPELVEELKGIAAGASVDWNDLRVTALGRLVGDFPSSPAAGDDECSCFAATGPATVDGRLILAKDGDLPVPSIVEDDFLIQHVKPDHGYSYTAIGCFPERPTQPEGMNERGLTIVGCGQKLRDGYQAYKRGLPVGVPVHHMEAVIYQECTTLEEALEVLKESPRGHYGRTMFLGDASGRWVKVEISYDGLATYRPEPEVNYPGNHLAAGVSGVFSLPGMHWRATSRAERPPAYVRYDRYLELLAENAGKIDIELTKSILGDHKNGPGAASICKHADGPTLTSVVFSPGERLAWAAKGHPCEAKFHRIDLNASLRG